MRKLQNFTVLRCAVVSEFYITTSPGSMGISSSRNVCLSEARSKENLCPPILLLVCRESEIVILDQTWLFWTVASCKSPQQQQPFSLYVHSSLPLHTLHNITVSTLALFRVPVVCYPKSKVYLSWCDGSKVQNSKIAGQTSTFLQKIAIYWWECSNDLSAIFIQIAIVCDSLKRILY